MKVNTADTLCVWHLVKLLIESDITGHTVILLMWKPRM